MDKAIGQLKDSSLPKKAKEIEGILEGVQQYSSSPSALSGSNKRPFNTDALCGLKTLWTKFNRTTTREFSFLHRSGRI
jgi:hypothetical protein